MLVAPVVLLATIGGTSYTHAQAPSVDLTGRWTITFGVWRGLSPHVLDIRQNGKALSGRLATPEGNTVRVEGSVADDRVVLDFVYDTVQALAESVPVEVARDIVGVRSQVVLGLGSDPSQLSGRLAVFSASWGGTPPIAQRWDDGRVSSLASTSAITMTRVAVASQPPARQPSSQPPPAQPAPAQPARVPASRILAATAARGVVNGRAVDPSGVFDPDVNPIFVWFRHEGFPAGAGLASVWFYEGETPPRRIGEASMPIAPPTDWGQFNLELAPGRRWPVGRYRVELRLDDEVLTEVQFRVAEPTASESTASRAPVNYTHPRFGFMLAVPNGWSIEESPSGSTVLKRADGSGLIEITAGATSVPLDPVSYAAGWESVSVGPGARLRARQAERLIDVDGSRAFEGTYEGDGVAVRAVFLGRPDRFFVFTAIAPRDDSPLVFETFGRLLAGFASGAR